MHASCESPEMALTGTDKLVLLCMAIIVLHGASAKEYTLRAIEILFEPRGVGGRCSCRCSNPRCGYL